MVNLYWYIAITITFLIISLILYVVFFYVPIVEYENNFNEALDNANFVLQEAQEYEDEIEETNELVSLGISNFCEFYNEGGPLPIVYFGSTFDELCS